MDSLFSWKKTRTRHKEAPLLIEREAFLAHLLNQGCSLQRIRSIAALVLTVHRVMKVTALREVDRAEIERAASCWAANGLLHGHQAAGPTSEGTFTHVTEKWLRFHGKLLTHAIIPKPSEAPVEEFAIAMKQQRGLSPQTIRGYRSRSALFLDWLADQRGKTLQDLSLPDVDAYLASKRLLGWKARSLATQCQAMRTFLRYAEVQGWCHPGIAQGIESPTLPNTTPYRKARLERCKASPCTHYR